MILSSIYKDSEDQITGFKITGHADSGPYGQDIVCAAVSVLAINTINSIEQLTSIKPLVDSNDEEGGYLSVTIPEVNNESDKINIQTLLRSLEIGLSDVSKSYKKYFKMN